MKNDKHKKYLDRMFEVARDVAPVRSSKIAACIVIKNRVISIGVNSYKSSPFQKKYGTNSQSICIHAEVDAIKKALKRVGVEDLKRSTMYISCVKKEIVDYKCNEIQGLVKPCVGCTRAIVAFGIKKVFYTTDINNEYNKL